MYCFGVAACVACFPSSGVWVCPTITMTAREAFIVDLSSSKLLLDTSSSAMRHDGFRLFSFYPTVGYSQPPASSGANDCSGWSSYDIVICMAPHHPLTVARYASFVRARSEGRRVAVTSVAGRPTSITEETRR